MNHKCPFAPPYPSGEEALIDATQRAAGQLRDSATHCRPPLRHALLVMAHDAVQQVLEMLRNDGQVSLEERQRQCEETRSRVRIIQAAHHERRETRLH